MKKSKKTKPLKKIKQKTRDRRYSTSQIKKKYEIKEEKTVSNKVWGILLVVCLVFLFFIPREIAYPANRNDIIISLLIVVFLPFLVYTIVKPFDEKGIITTLSCVFFPLVFGLIFSFFQEYQEEKELQLHGIITKCFVINRKMASKGGFYNIECKYFADGKEFITYFHSEMRIEYSIGDTLELTYNKDFPLMYKINLE